MANCHYCGCLEGELHLDIGCEEEICPFCDKADPASCGCIWVQLGLLDESKWDASTNHFDPRIYHGGAETDEYDEWDRILERKGRIPYINTSARCYRCGSAIDPVYRADVQKLYAVLVREGKVEVCRSCHDYIVRVTKNRRTQHVDVAGTTMYSVDV